MLPELIECEAFHLLRGGSFRETTAVDIPQPKSSHLGWDRDLLLRRHLPERQVADHGIRRQHVKPFIGFAIEGNATVPDASESNNACEDIVQDACDDESRYRPMLIRERRALNTSRRGSEEHGARPDD